MYPERLDTILKRTEQNRALLQNQQTMGSNRDRTIDVTRETGTQQQRPASRLLACDEYRAHKLHQGDILSIFAAPGWPIASAHESPGSSGLVHKSLTEDVCLSREQEKPVRQPTFSTGFKCPTCPVSCQPACCSSGLLVYRGRLVKERQIRIIETQNSVDPILQTP